MILSGDTSGAITLSAPAVAGTNTITLPAAAGSVMVSGNMPAFSAGQTTPQSLTAGTRTKILFQTEEFDTNNNFASSVFTPTVAGYYQINARVRISSTLTNLEIYVYKNGVLYKEGTSSDSTAVGGVVSTLLYCNGSTDYIEIYGRFSNTQNTSGTSPEVYFNGSMVRAA